MGFRRWPLAPDFQQFACGIRGLIFLRVNTYLKNPSAYSIIDFTDDDMSNVGELVLRRFAGQIDTHETAVGFQGLVTPEAHAKAIN